LAWNMTTGIFSRPMTPDAGIGRPYGADDFFMTTVSTKRPLLTELEKTGSPHGPSLYHLLEIIGRDKTLERIEKAMGSF
jgi:Anticodon binding domain